jgi:hypothetical protein
LEAKWPLQEETTDPIFILKGHRGDVNSIRYCKAKNVLENVFGQAPHKWESVWQSPNPVPFLSWPIILHQVILQMQLSLKPTSYPQKDQENRVVGHIK